MSALDRLLERERAFLKQEWAALVFIVVLVALVLAILIIPQRSASRWPRSHSSASEAARAKLNNLAVAIDMFAVDSGGLPERLEELKQEDSASGGPRPAWKDMTSDPWGRKVRYKRVNDRFEVRSAGPDGRFDTFDDIWK